MAYYCKIKDKTLSFRTFSETNKKLEALAERISRHKYNFAYKSPMRHATSKAGLIHELVSGNLTFEEIEKQLEIVEVK